MKNNQDKLTGSQRTKNYMERRKANGYGEIDKEKNREKVRAYRERLKKNCQKWKDHLSYQAKRKREIRKRNKENQQLNKKDQIGYNCVQTLEKVHRAKKNLPTHATKRTALIQELAKAEGLPLIDKVGMNRRQINTLSTSNEIIEDVTAFYLSSDISWQSPNMKHRVILSNKNQNGEIEKKYYQKRYMLLSYREAYAEYLKLHPSVKISFAKFHRLKPAFVCSFKHIPHEVCICKIHENMHLLIQALHDYCNLPITLRELVDSLTCDSSKDACMLGKCTMCTDLINGFDPYYFNEDLSQKELNIKQWMYKDRLYKLENLQLSVERCFEELKSQTKAFLNHVFIKRNQAQYFENSIQSSDGKSVCIQIDYAENFALQYQREIQAAHWHQSQCTIFTAHAWINESKTKSYAFVSDCLDHGKLSVYKNLEVVFDDLLNNSNDIREVKIFSDSAASQFKQRYILSLLPVFQSRYGVKFVWNYFAASHGKGVVDGISATIKGSVWRRIRSGENVNTAADFVKVAENACPNISVVYISKNEIELNSDELEAHWADVLPIPHLRQMHSVRVVNENTLAIKQYAYSVNGKEVVIM